MSNEITDLDKQIAELTEKRQAILNGKRQEAIQEAKMLVARYALTANELGLNIRGKSSAIIAKTPPKYANPSNPNETWAGGKGARPKWVREHLAKGGALDGLLISK